jgi:hypothetical protein
MGLSDLLNRLLGRHPRAGPRHLTREDVRERLGSHVHASYLNYAYFIKGAVVAVAALCLVDLVAEDVTGRLPRVGLWLASFFFSLVTIATWARGSAFASYRASMIDIIAPMAIGVCEVALFIVLIPSKDLPGEVWRNWYVVQAAFSVCAIVLIANRYILCREVDYRLDDNELQQMFFQYRKWLREDMAGAAAFGCASIAFWWLRTRCDCFADNALDNIDLAAAALSAAFPFVVLIRTADQHRKLADL